MDCDCGAKHTKEPHARWCSSLKLAGKPSEVVILDEAQKVINEEVSGTPMCIVPLPNEDRPFIHNPTEEECNGYVAGMMVTSVDHETKTVTIRDQVDACEALLSNEEFVKEWTRCVKTTEGAFSVSKLREELMVSLCKARGADPMLARRREKTQWRPLEPSIRFRVCYEDAYRGTRDKPVGSNTADALQEALNDQASPYRWTVTHLDDCAAYEVFAVLEGYPLSARAYKAHQILRMVLRGKK